MVFLRWILLHHSLEWEEVQWEEEHSLDWEIYSLLHDVSNGKEYAIFINALYFLFIIIYI